MLWTFSGNLDMSSVSPFVDALRLLHEAVAYLPTEAGVRELLLKAAELAVDGTPLNRQALSASQKSAGEWTHATAVDEQAQQGAHASMKASTPVRRLHYTRSHPRARQHTSQRKGRVPLRAASPSRLYNTTAAFRSQHGTSAMTVGDVGRDKTPPSSPRGHPVGQESSTASAPAPTHKHQRGTLPPSSGCIDQCPTALCLRRAALSPRTHARVVSNPLRVVIFGQSLEG